MDSISAVAEDRCSEAGAPEAETIEMTPLMIEAGVAKLLDLRGGVPPEDQVEAVYRAMFAAYRQAGGSL